jgi:hypothetical protein
MRLAIGDALGMQDAAPGSALRSPSCLCSATRFGKSRDRLPQLLLGRSSRGDQLQIRVDRRQSRLAAHLRQALPGRRCRVDLEDCQAIFGRNLFEQLLDVCAPSAMIGEHQYAQRHPPMIHLNR